MLLHGAVIRNIAFLYALSAIAWMGSPAAANTAPDATVRDTVPSGNTSAVDAAPSPAALFFGKKCGSCHTIGDGDRTGPDLLGVTQRRDAAWIRRFIINPSAAIDAGDPIANELLGKFKQVRMPEQVVTDEQLTALIAYLEQCTAQRGCKLVLGKVKHANEAKAADVRRGKRLFEGRDSLSAGGPSCLSCHSARGAGIVGGGTLARDLTYAYARLGDAVISSSLADTPFPLMKDVYPRRPLRPDEAFALKAYLAQVAKGPNSMPDQNFVYLGVIGLLVALGMIGLAWRNRGNASGVRGAYVGQQGEAQ